MVVLFILSVVASFTIPMFKAPGTTAPGSTAQGRQLARFIESLKLRAARDQTDYFLHLDLMNQTVWATTGDQNAAGQGPSNSKDDSITPAAGMEGLSLSRVDLAGTRDQDLENIVIRIFKGGVCDMALIHMETEAGQITLKLEPFIHEVVIFGEDIGFDDCL